MAPSPPPPTGTQRPSASTSDRRFPVAMKRRSMTAKSPVSCSPCAEHAVRVPAGSVTLDGNLSLPAGAGGIVLFAHGSGSSRHSPRNRYVARLLNEAKLATLLIDLLTQQEEAIDMRTAQLRFDIELLAERLVAATDWLTQQPESRHLRLGHFGASTGAGARVGAGAEPPDGGGGGVSRGGRAGVTRS